MLEVQYLYTITYYIIADAFKCRNNFNVAAAQDGTHLIYCISYIL